LIGVFRVSRRGKAKRICGSGFPGWGKRIMGPFGGGLYSTPFMYSLS
jgi:hypothetical protein